MHETSVQGWCTGMNQRDGMGREVGGGSGWGTQVNPWLIHVNIWQKPLRYCKVISLQMIKSNWGKKVLILISLKNFQVLNVRYLREVFKILSNSITYYGMFETFLKSFLKKLVLGESRQRNELKIMCTGEKWLLR